MAKVERKASPATKPLDTACVQNLLNKTHHAHQCYSAMEAVQFRAQKSECPTWGKGSSLEHRCWGLPCSFGADHGLNGYCHRPPNYSCQGNYKLRPSHVEHVRKTDARPSLQFDVGYSLPSHLLTMQRLRTGSWVGSVQESDCRA